MSVQDSPTCVSILDREFRIACPEEKQATLHQAAEYLDKQMRLIRRQGRVIGIERIAVMAALNIAHDLIMLQNGDTQSSATDLSDRIKQLQNKIDDALHKGQMNQSEQDGSAETQSDLENQQNHSAAPKRTTQQQEALLLVPEEL